MADDDGGNHTFFQQTPERRAGFAELALALKESSRNLEVNLTKKIEDHSNESRDGISRLSEETRASISALTTEMKINGKIANDVATTLAPLPERIAELHTKVAQIAENDKQQFKMIGKIKDGHRDLEVTIAKIPKGKDSTVSGSSFWESSNGKYVIWAGIIVLLGLLGLAGYNVSLNDIPH